MDQNSPVHVLMIEDNPGDARLVHELLADTTVGRFVLHHMERLTDGLSWLQKNKADVILLDLSLPDSQGLETVHSVRDSFADLPIVVLTGHVDTSIGLTAVQAGCQDFLTKGSSDGDLIARTIRYAIERKRSEAALRESEARYRTLVDASPEAILVCRTGHITFANPAAAALLQAEDQDSLIGIEYGPLLRELNALIEATTSFSPVSPVTPKVLPDARIHTLTGGKAHVEATAIPIQTTEEPGVQLILRDISARREAEREQRLAAAVFRTSAEGMIVTDTDTTIIAANPAFCHMTGYRSEELVGQSPKLWSSGRHGRDFYSKMWTDLNKSGHWHGEIWNRRKNGEVFVQRVVISAITDDEGFATNYVAVFSDITDEKREAEEVLYHATHDALTALPNRVLLKDRLDQAVAIGSRYHGGVAVLFIDLDGFKPINDQHGHVFGDLLLQAVARRLQGCIRDSDTVARLGGDEFVIVARGNGGKVDADNIAEKVLSVLHQPFQIQGLEARIGCSIGIALFPTHAQHGEALLDCADQAMYRAKHSGKGTYRYYDPEEQAKPKNVSGAA